MAKTLDSLTGANNTGLRFVTGFRYAERILKNINNMTFMYDANWGGSSNDAVTLPIVFFQLKGIHEVMDSEVQTKKVMFYDSEQSTNPDSTTGSVLNVIADNIVNKPKTYKLDVIVPMESLTMMFNMATFSSYQTGGVADVLARAGIADSLKNNNGLTSSGQDSDINSSYDKVSVVMKSTSAVIEIITGLLKGIVNVALSANSVASILSTPSYNKDSLEGMWRNRTIVRLKLWNGWKFKYVVITNIDITKEPTEDGVEEATITCTEVPIMTMRTKASIAKMKAKSTQSLIELTAKEAKDSSIKIASEIIADGDEINNTVFSFSGSINR